MPNEYKTRLGTIILGSVENAMNIFVENLGDMVTGMTLIGGFDCRFADIDHQIGLGGESIVSECVYRTKGIIHGEMSREIPITGSSRRDVSIPLFVTNSEITL